MFRSRFLWKLYAGYVLLILLSAVIVGGLVSRWIEQNSLEEIKQSLRARAVLLADLAAPTLSESSSSDFQERVRTLGGEIGTRLTVIAANGEVIADSREKPSEMDNHAARPEILAARSHGLGTTTRLSDTLGTKMMYLAVPIHKNERLVGYVRTSLALSEIDERLNHLRAIITLGAGLAAIVALVLGFFVARAFAKPLRSMATVAESIAHGDYQQRLPTTRKDEIGKLSQAINRMAEGSRNRMETITSDRNKLLAILAGMTEGVIAVDRNERVVHLNAAAGKILAASPEESLDKPIWEITRVGEVSQVLANTLRDKSDLRAEMRLPTRSSDQVVEMHSSPLRDGKGNVVGAVVVLHDVSRLQRLETVRRDFVANASHELKTPITAIRGLVETLIDDEGIAPENRERFLGKIRNQSVRLSSIVTDLLTLSRLESERGVLKYTALDLRDAVLASAQALVSTAEEKGIVLETQLPEVSVEVAGDNQAIGQVVTNLLDNALKYTPKGGQVWVRLRTEAAKAVLEVQDTGIGIEPNDRDRIFERFYRVDKARSRELGGTGLGLSIVKHIVLTHNGQVSLDSTPGTGSTFRVSLPLAPASA
ncbi:MAG: HAMP domain-containing protein [Actinobacteria bacterium]|nr:HAMP domain-containing protein [Actinomycetota bacterium]